MYRITFIVITNGGPRVESVSHPNLQVMRTLHDALTLAGVHVRLWGRDGKQLRPQRD